jgi:hypothetical protein
VASIEHLAFYLNSDDAKSLTQKKSYFMKSLRAGYQGPPVGYVSIQEKRQRQYLEDLKAKNDRIKKLNAEIEQYEYEIWLSEQSRDALQSILATGGITKGMDPGNQIARDFIRAHFTREIKSRAGDSTADTTARLRVM